MIGAPTPILRVSPAIDEKQRTKHRRYLAVYEMFDAVIDRWRWLRIMEQSSGEMKWEVILYVEDPVSARLIPMTIVIGADSNGSYNLVSMHRIDASRVRRMLRAGQLISGKG